MPLFAYDVGAPLVTVDTIMDWYVHAKDKQSIAYFEGSVLSLFFARHDERKDCMPVIQLLDKLADEGRVVLVHQRLEPDVNGSHRWRYIAQRVPASRMKDNRRSERWHYNTEGCHA